MFLDTHIDHGENTLKFFSVKVIDSVIKFISHPSRTRSLHLIGKCNLLTISKTVVGKPKDEIIR